MAYPEYLDLIRKEMASVCPEGQPPTPESTSKLWKMDSVLKESQRLNAMSLGQFSH